jgi:hypothetical protein
VAHDTDALILFPQPLNVAAHKARPRNITREKKCRAGQARTHRLPLRSHPLENVFEKKSKKTIPGQLKKKSTKKKTQERQRKKKRRPIIKALHRIHVANRY